MNTGAIERCIAGVLISVYFSATSWGVEYQAGWQEGVDAPQGLSHGVALGDVDSDGDLDAVVAKDGKNPDIVWLNNGRGGFVDSGQRLGNADSKALALADLDGDGDLDAWVVGLGGKLGRRSLNHIWFNGGGGQFMESEQRLLGKQADTSIFADELIDVELGDVDGDGDIDAWIAKFQTVGTELSGHELWLNDGAGNFTYRDMGLSFSGNSVALADMDDDGDLDAVAGIGSTARLFLNDGKAGFIDSGQIIGFSLNANDSTDLHSVAVGDIDGDQSIDILLSSVVQPTRYWSNLGDAQFAGSGQLVGDFKSASAVLSDLDADGDVDLWTAKSGGLFADPRNQVWLNDGNGLLLNQGQLLGESSSHQVAIGDLDGNSSLDAWVANGEDQDQVWLSSGVDVALLPVNKPTFLKLGSLSVNHEWKTIQPGLGLNAPNLEDYVVLLGVPSYQGVTPGVVRMNNKNGKSFQLRFQEFLYADDNQHKDENIDYLIVRRGIYQEGDLLVQSEVFSQGGTGKWKQIKFKQAFDRIPRVFLSMQTANGGIAAAVRVRNVTESGFEAAIFEEEAQMGSGHAPESIAYVALGNVGNGSLTELDVNGSAIKCDTVNTRISNKSQLWIKPDLTRVFGIPNSQLKEDFLIMQEDQSLDNERTHVKENVDVLKVGKALFAQPVSSKGQDPYFLRRK